MFAAYPHLSGFATFNNNPISYADPTGYTPCDACDTPLLPHYDGGGENSASTDDDLTVSDNSGGKSNSNTGSNIVETVIDKTIDLLKVVDNETGGLVSEVKYTLQMVRKGIQIQASYNPITGKVHKGLYNESQTPLTDLDGNEVPFEDAMFAPASLGLKYLLRTKLKQKHGTRAFIETVVDEEVEEKEKEKRGITVLGSWNAVNGGYIALAKQLGAHYFSIPQVIWSKMTKDERWAANLKFLDRMIARGDKIILSNSAFKAKPGTSFYEELQYLYSKGYKPSADGMSIIKK